VLTVRDLFSVIWRGRWIVVACMVVTLAAGAAYVKIRTPTYQAAADIQLQGLQTGQNAAGAATTGTAPPALDDPVSLLSSPATVQRAERQLADDPTAQSATITGTLDPTGTSFAVSASSHDAAAAAAAANAYAAAFVYEVGRVVQSSVDDIQAQITSLTTQITSLEAAERSGDPAAQAEVAAASTELETLYGEKTALQVSGPTYAQVQHAALVPSVSSGLSDKKVAILAALVGLLAGCGIVLARSQLDTRLRARPELEEIAGFPILAELPNDRRLRGQKGRIDAPSPALAEALRELRTTLQVALEDKPCPVVLVTSPSPGDGKTLVVANLAVAWASSGRRVVVVSADLRRPQLEQVLGVLASGPGLCDLASLDRRDRDAAEGWPAAAGEGRDAVAAEFHHSRPLPDRNAVAAALVPTEVPGLAVLPCGGVAQNPSELLGSPGMHAVMDRLVGLADLVILDTPPVLVVSDASELARQVDGVVLVASEGKTSREEVEQAVGRLNTVKAHLIGVVLNRVRKASAASYHAYYDATRAASEHP
jgi:tyrosine-protein kinase Etk/Wzc